MNPWGIEKVWFISLSEDEINGYLEAGFESSISPPNSGDPFGEVLFEGETLLGYAVELKSQRSWIQYVFLGAGYWGFVHSGDSKKIGVDLWAKERREPIVVHPKKVNPLWVSTQMRGISENLVPFQTKIKVDSFGKLFLCFFGNPAICRGNAYCWYVHFDEGSYETTVTIRDVLDKRAFYWEEGWAVNPVLFMVPKWKKVCPSKL